MFLLLHSRVDKSLDQRLWFVDLHHLQYSYTSRQVRSPIKRKLSEVVTTENTLILTD